MMSTSPANRSTNQRRQQTDSVGPFHDRPGARRAPLLRVRPADSAARRITRHGCCRRVRPCHAAIRGRCCCAAGRCEDTPAGGRARPADGCLRKMPARPGSPARGCAGKTLSGLGTVDDSRTCHRTPCRHGKRGTCTLLVGRGGRRADDPRFPRHPGLVCQETKGKTPPSA